MGADESKEAGDGETPQGHGHGHSHGNAQDKPESPKA
jgi:hypothetical protein